MTSVLLGTTVLLAAAVVVLLVRVARLERRVVDPPRSETPVGSAPPADLTDVSLDAGPAEFVITDVGVSEPEPVPVVEPRLFADIVLRETVVQAGMLVHGLRRALAPESRNRIRFEMRREVRRLRKQRRADLRVARREWEARQRAALEPEPEDSAA